jgi:hypothetical protein
MKYIYNIYILPGPWTPKGPPVGRLAVPRAPRKTSRCEPKERKGQVTGDHCGGVSHGCHGLLVYGIYIYGTTMDNPSWGTCWVGLFHVIIYPATSSRMILKQYLWPNWWSLLESPRGMFFGDGQNHNSLVLLKLPENFLEKLRMVIIPNERKSMT